MPKGCVYVTEQCLKEDCARHGCLAARCRGASAASHRCRPPRRSRKSGSPGVKPPTALVLPARTPQPSPAQRTELKVGELRFELLRDQRRCLVTPLGSLETLQVEWRPPRVAGTIEVSQAATEGTAYDVPASSLSIHLAERRQRRLVVFRLSTDGVELALET